MNKFTMTAAALAAGLVAAEASAAATDYSMLGIIGSTNQLVLTDVFPGQVALGWVYFLTAQDGGGQTNNALIASATTIGPNERFTVQQISGYLSFVTANGNFVSVTDGVANVNNVTQTTLTAAADTTLFSYTPYLGSPPGIHLTTYYGYSLDWKPGAATAAIGDVPAGSNPGAVATGFNVRQCGQLGSGYQYSILMLAPGFSNDPVPSQELGAIGGREVDGVYVAGTDDGNERFTLILQDDGSYAIQLANGTNYVTAADDGGLAHGTPTSDTLHTDATQIGSWERFRIVDQGNCTYTLQTHSGYYVGYNLNDNSPTAAPTKLSLSTDISDPAAAGSIGYSASFVLQPLWNTPIP